MSWGEPHIHNGLATLTNFNGDVLTYTPFDRDDLHIQFFHQVQQMLKIPQDVALTIIYEGDTFPIDSDIENPGVAKLVRDYVPDETYEECARYCEAIGDMRDIDGFEGGPTGEARRGQRDCSMPGLCKTREAMALGHWGS